MALQRRFARCRTVASSLLFLALTCTLVFFINDSAHVLGFLAEDANNITSNNTTSIKTDTYTSKKFGGEFPVVAGLPPNFFDDPALQRDIASRGFDLTVPVDWRIRKWLAPLQYPEYCGPDTRALVYRWGAVGFGAEMLHLVQKFAYAIQTQRVFIFDDPSEMRYATPACSHGWHCFFEHYSGCLNGQVDLESEGTDLANTTRQPNINIGDNRLVKHDSLPDPWTCSFSHYVPPQFRRRDPARDQAWINLMRDCSISAFEELPGGKGLEEATQELLWFRAQLAAYTFQPLPHVLQGLEDFLTKSRVLEYAQNTRAPGNEKRTGIIGIHIRRGDKVNHEDVFHPLSKYLAEAEHFRRIAKVNTVYLASDDMVAIKAEAAEFKNWTFVFDESRNEKGASFGDYSSNRAIKDMGDLWTLSECNYLIGSGATAYLRIAQFLGLAKGTYKGYRFLDGLDILIGHVRVPRASYMNWRPRT